MSTLKYGVYGIGGAKKYENHTFTGAVYLHQEKQLDSLNFDYKLKCGSCLFGAALDINSPQEDNRSFDKTVNYEHTFNRTTFGGQLKLIGDDNKFSKSLWAKYVNSDNLGFKQEVSINDDGSETQLKTKVFFVQGPRSYTVGLDLNGKLEYQGGNIEVKQGPYGAKFNYKHKNQEKELSGSWKKDKHNFQAGVSLDKSNTDPKIGFMWNYNF